MSGGDTAVFGNGSYSAPACAAVPGNASVGYTTFKAEQMGGATMTEINCQYGSGTHSYYWVIDGFFFNGTAILISYVDHVKMIRDGSMDAGNDNVANFSAINGSSDILFEQSYAFGSGRYKFLAYKANNVVFRQNVARMDKHTFSAGNQDVVAGMTIYSTSNGVIENSIVIDSTAQYVTNPLLFCGCFCFPQTAGSSSNITVESNVCLNSQMGSGAMFEFQGGTSRTNGETFHNNVVWNTDYPFNDTVFMNFPAGTNYQNWNQNTFGVSSVGYYFMTGYGASNLTSNNNIYYNIGEPFADGNWASSNHDYNSYWQVNNSRPSLNSHETTSINPIWNASTNPTGALKYITRIEPGSNLAGAGLGGANIGATLQYMVGAPGTLFGETGYNTVQSTPMWPFPNETVIKAKMAAYTGPPSGARGFAAAGTGLYGGPITLTSYIWEYLGNPCPTGICTTTPDTTPPTSPTSLSASATSSSSISVSWTASTDNVAVTSYIVERCQGSGCSNFTQVGTPTTSPFVDSGLTASTFYNYHVRAVDAAGNLSGWSNVVGATTQSASAGTNYFSWGVEANNYTYIGGTWTLNPATDYRGGTTRDCTVAHTGSCSMKQVIIGNDAGNNPQGLDGVNGNGWAPINYGWKVVGSPALYYRWWMKIMPGFNWGLGTFKTKSSRVGGPESAGSPQVYTGYLNKDGVRIDECASFSYSNCRYADGSGSDAAADINYPPPADGQWHEWIVKVKPNTSATCTAGVNCNAEFGLWVDGVSRGQYNGWKLHSSASTDMVEYWLGWASGQMYWQLNGVPGDGGTIYFDDMSTDTCPGHTGTALPCNSLMSSDTTPPAAPSGLGVL
jgi:hypothetical protein